MQGYGDPKWEDLFRYARDLGVGLEAMAAVSVWSLCERRADDAEWVLRVGDVEVATSVSHDLEAWSVEWVLARAQELVVIWESWLEQAPEEGHVGSRPYPASPRTALGPLEARLRTGEVMNATRSALLWRRSALLWNIYQPPRDSPEGHAARVLLELSDSGGDWESFAYLMADAAYQMTEGSVPACKAAADDILAEGLGFFTLIRCSVFSSPLGDPMYDYYHACSEVEAQCLELFQGCHAVEISSVYTKVNLCLAPFLLSATYTREVGLFSESRLLHMTASVIRDDARVPIGVHGVSHHFNYPGAYAIVDMAYLEQYRRDHSHLADTVQTMLRLQPKLEALLLKFLLAFEGS